MARTSSAMIKFFVGSGCWPLKTRNARSTGKHRKDHDLDEGRVFQIALQFAARPAAPQFSRGEAASDESSAFEKIEHVVFTCVVMAQAIGAADRR